MRQTDMPVDGRMDGRHGPGAADGPDAPAGPSRRTAVGAAALGIATLALPRAADAASPAPSVDTSVAPVSSASVAALTASGSGAPLATLAITTSEDPSVTGFTYALYTDTSGDGSGGTLSESGTLTSTLTRIGPDAGDDVTTSALRNDQTHRVEVTRTLDGAVSTVLFTTTTATAAGADGSTSTSGGTGGTGASVSLTTTDLAQTNVFTTNAVAFRIAGASGGDGGKDDVHTGGTGGEGRAFVGRISLALGDTVTVHCGGGGGRGADDRQGDVAGGEGGGGTSTLSGYSGGLGGHSGGGSEAASGCGGGGGAATVLRVVAGGLSGPAEGATAAEVVAAGGGGAGGSGNALRTEVEENGQPTDVAQRTGDTDGGDGSRPGSDGGGGGGGGGGATGGAGGPATFTISGEFFGDGGFQGASATTVDGSWTGGAVTVDSESDSGLGSSAGGTAVLDYLKVTHTWA